MYRAVLLTASLLAPAGAGADDREALKSLIDKVVTAAGGPALSAAKAWSFTERITVKGETTTYRRYVQPPGRFRTEIDHGSDGERAADVIVVDGAKGWTVSGGTFGELSADGVAGWRKGAFWTSAPLVAPRALADPRSVLTRLPDSKVDGRAAAGVGLTRPDAGSVRLFFDAETGRLLQAEQDDEGADGKKDVSAVRYGDYRAAGGVVVPHAKTLLSNGKAFGTWVLSDYKFMDSLDAKLFERPAGSAAPPPEAAFAAEFRAVKGAAEAKQRELLAALKKVSEAAKSEDEREAAMARAHRDTRGVMAPACARVLAAVRPHAADPAAAEALAWVADNSYGADAGTEVAGLLAKHHPGAKPTLDLADRYRRSPLRWTEPLLRAQLAAPGLAAADRPRVLRALAEVKQARSEMPAKLAHLGPGQSEVYGPGLLAEYRTLDPAKEEAEAVRLFTELRDKHGSENLVRDVTYGALAASALYEIRNLSVGKPAPDIAGEDTDGAPFKLSDSRGKVVLLTFWGTWCGPCMAMVPHEKEIAERLKGRPFVIVGVNSDADKGKLRPAVKAAGITWRSFWCGAKGPDGAVPAAWNVTGWPTVYVLDHKGVIRAKQPTGKALDRVVDALVREAEAGR